jgi:hypothetical protein
MNRPVPGRDATAVFACTMTDGDGNTVRIEVLPRTRFAGLGYQTGIRLATLDRKGNPAMAQTIGLSDADADALVQAIMLEGSRA